ncbi:hypothetical protein [Novosphingobium cyanobacteriorum]|uniref:Uncharacterized protein n=1 Tax=Novosphingobium cyanobacteriorum TaxID=3024215 RepID=A0ABT6CCN4_9SPHN|nr:hypothetical protein [Novosphingobium cyanobacteriorum]MDF8331689.1 hypothetical protein [Novosphingobium cyanobacteriorum]
MSARDEQALIEARALRTEAWALVKQDMARLKGGLEAKPIGQRIKDRATEQAFDVVDEAVAVASDNKAVIGITVAALVGWLFRGPLWNVVQPWLPAGEPETWSDRLADWLPFKGD